MNTIVKKLTQKKNLTRKEARSLVLVMAEGSMPETEMKKALLALKEKGETTGEIAGFIDGMREKMVRMTSPVGTIDTCGTGGDGKQTFNISTAVAFVVAGAGVSVAKHGNRAASSKCGSADVLEALGVTIQLSPQQAETVLQNVGMVFLFAPLYHPAMKYIGPVRKALGVPTVFNLLGPFLNPAGVKRQLIGVSKKETAKKLSKVGKALDYQQLFLVSSKDGMDEVSIAASTDVFSVIKGKIEKFTIDPSTFGLSHSSLNELLGGDARENAVIINEILSGKNGAKTDVVLLNSAVALLASGKIKTMKKGIEIARESIASGSAKNILQMLRKETQKYS